MKGLRNQEAKKRHERCAASSLYRKPGEESFWWHPVRSVSGLIQGSGLTGRPWLLHARMSPSGVPRLQPAASHNAQPGPGSSLSFPGKNAKPPPGGAEELPGPFRRSASPLSSASRFYRPDAAQPAAMLGAPRPLHNEAARKPGSGSPARLGAAYFDQPCIPLAKALLGQVSSSTGGGGTTGSCKGAPSRPGQHGPLLSRKRAAPVALPPGQRASCGPWQSGRHTGTGKHADVRQARPDSFQILVRKLPDGRELRGRIVETEAYLGGEDTASHSRGGRRTLRNAAMFMRPGTLYVYQIYGIYYCMNVSSQGKQAEAGFGQNPKPFPLTPAPPTFPTFGSRGWPATLTASHSRGEKIFCPVNQPLTLAPFRLH